MRRRDIGPLHLGSIARHGEPGRRGRPHPYLTEDYLDPSKSQWYNACSSGGKYYYTYGDDYDYGSKCNDADRKPEATAPTDRRESYCSETLRLYPPASTVPLST